MTESPDFGGLAGLNLPKGMINSIKQARIEARSVIESIEPLYVTSWTDLIMKLKDALKKAKRNEKIHGYNPSPKAER